VFRGEVEEVAHRQVQNFGDTREDFEGGRVDAALDLADEVGGYAERLGEVFLGEAL
jgi:hypothetical protein